MKTENKDRLPRILGYLGLLPFIIPTFFLFSDPHHFMTWRSLLVSYAAIILSFLGGLYWAFAMVIKDVTIKKRNAMLVWSVIPSLLAWVALLLSQQYAFIALATFFVTAFFVDNQFSRVTNLPAWYMPLRMKLTLVVTSCLMAAAFLAKQPLISA